MSARPALRLVQTAIEPGYCHCGCGGRTSLVKMSNTARGIVAGEPRKYLPNHTHRRVLDPDYVAEDRGYITPCWVWQKATTDGYGVLRRDGGTSRAHIVSYEEHVGPVPDGLQLDHLCRVRACINPEHLEPVTQVENIRRGDLTRLTSEQVREMRELLSAGMTKAEAGRRFGVSASNVRAIATRRSWKDVA